MSIENIPLSLIEVLLSTLLFCAGAIAVIFALGRSSSFLFPLFAALIVRTVVAWVHRLFFVIPQGQKDAVVMEQHAWEWSQSGCGNMGEHLELGASYVHSWLVGNIYACTGRGPLVFQTVNVLLGVLTVYLVARIAEQLWGRQVAVRAAWVAALFPMLIIYSSVPLREVWFTALLMLGALHGVLWLQRGSMVYLCAAATSIFVASIFHGGAFFALLAVVAMLVVWGGGEFFRGVQSGKLKGSIFFGAVALSTVVGVGFLTLDELRFSSIGDVTQVMQQLDSIEERTISRAHSGAAYPSYLLPSGDLSTLLLTPARMVYLLVSPLPWDVKAANHLLGMLDGLLYLTMLVLLWRYRGHWWHRREFRIVFFVLLALVLVYGWGTSNFGTGLRHRAKFVGLFIALGAGLLGSKAWRRKQLEELDLRKPS